MSEKKSLQETWAPNSICFGCGPANTKGLRIRSFDEGELVTCEWTPAPHHHAFPGMVNGGILGSIMDCHCNWTAAWRLKEKWALESIPCTVTAEYTVKLLRPTPIGTKLKLKSQIKEFIKQNRAWVECQLFADDVETATCRGLFVAVKEGHPAYHRWS